MRFDLGIEKGLPITLWEEGPGAGSGVSFSVEAIDGVAGTGGLPSSPRRHGFFQILYVSEGIGTFHVDFEGYPIEPGGMYFVNPVQVHFAEIIKSVRGYLLSFPDDFLSIDPSRESTVFELAFFQSPDREPMARFDKATSQDIVAVIDALQSEFQKRGNGYVTVLRSYLHILLVRASRGLRSPSVPRSVSSATATTRRFRLLVTEQVRTVRSVNSYAQQLGISPGHLHDVVKSSTGETPSDIIQQELMLEAKRLLAHTDMSIAEVGFKLCFDDPAYFGRYFRRNQKMSPGQYRNQVRKSFWSSSAESAA